MDYNKIPRTLTFYKKVLWIVSSITIINFIISCYCLYSFIQGSQGGQPGSLSGENYISLLVTFLGLCITFVIGYQIINVIEVKDELRELRESKEQIQKDNRLSLYYNAYTIGKIHMQNDVYSHALRAFNNGIKHLLGTDVFDKNIEKILEYMNICVNELHQTRDKNNQSDIRLVAKDIASAKYYIMNDPKFLESGYINDYTTILQNFEILLG